MNEAEFKQKKLKAVNKYKEDIGKGKDKIEDRINSMLVISYQEGFDDAVRLVKETPMERP